MNQNKSVDLGVAIASILATTGVAQASTYNATLVESRIYGRTGSQPGNQTSSTATWSYDDVTNLLTQTGGLYNVRFVIAVTTTLFRHSITGLVIGNGSVASAASYACAEGGFGSSVGASICGNYEFGANFINESTSAWGPGTATSRTMGGDDVASGPQQSIQNYNGFTQLSWVGTSLVLSNAKCDPALPGSASSCAPIGGFNTGFRWTLSTQLVPVPPAVWLFGSALGLMGVMRRRQAI